MVVILCVNVVVVELKYKAIDKNIVRNVLRQKESLNSGSFLMPKMVLIIAEKYNKYKELQVLNVKFFRA